MASRNQNCDDGVSRYRFFVPDISGDEVHLPPDQARHAIKVLRLTVGSSIELFDGNGGSAMGEIISAGRSELVAAVRRRFDPPDLTGPRLHLAFSIPKGGRMDWLAEKATELSARSLWPVLFERSVVVQRKLTEAKLDRWRGKCISAAKQCGLNYLPHIAQPATVGELIARTKDCLCLFGDTSAGASPIASVLSQPRRERDICLLVGPEGGLTEDERQLLLDSRFRPVKIAETILRVETAAITMLAIAGAMFGGMPGGP